MCDTAGDDYEEFIEYEFPDCIEVDGEQQNGEEVLYYNGDDDGYEVVETLDNDGEYSHLEIEQFCVKSEYIDEASSNENHHAITNSVNGDVDPDVNEYVEFYEDEEEIEELEYDDKAEIERLTPTIQTTKLPATAIAPKPKAKTSAKATIAKAKANANTNATATRTTTTTTTTTAAATTTTTPKNSKQTSNSNTSNNNNNKNSNVSSAKSDNIEKTFSYSGPRRYMLFDELVACIVDCDPDGTPIVEFSISNTESDENLPVECGICPDVMHKTKLAKHLKSHLVPGTNRYQCIYCEETYKDCKYLAGHARRHMGIRPYVCEVCKLYFSTKQDLRVHNQRRHQEKEHICEVCGKTFAQNTQLKRHREATHEKKRRFQCEHCPKSYYKNFSLQEHVRAVHMGKRRMIVCPFCGMQCRDAHKMARHRKQMHLNQSHYECNICNEEFTDINYFDAHKRSIQCRNNTKRKLEEEAAAQQQQIKQEVDEEDQEMTTMDIAVDDETAEAAGAESRGVGGAADGDDDDELEQQQQLLQMELNEQVSEVQIIDEEGVKHILTPSQQQQLFGHKIIEVLPHAEGDLNGDEELVYEITIDSNDN